MRTYSISKYPIIDGVMQLPDEREVCVKTAAGKREYERRVYAMVHRQKGRCAICTKPMLAPQFEHQRGRGMGGANQDDRITCNGNWLNAAVCGGCNTLKGSRRYSWQDGMYLPEGR